MENKKSLLFSIFLLFLTVTVTAGGRPGLRSHELLFVENKGQIKDQYQQYRSDVRFRLSAPGMNVFITNGSIHYQWSKMYYTGDPVMVSGNADFAPAALLTGSNDVVMKAEVYRLDVKLEGANPQAEIITEDRSVYMEHYYTGGSQQHIRASAWRKIICKEVYPGIDWVIYLKNGKLEYDFIVREGGRTSDIRIRYSGTDRIDMNPDGSITAHTPFGNITEQAPVSFQANGKPVSSRFVLKDAGVLGFSTGAYDGTLTIDPVVDWATYYGGAEVDGLNSAGIYGQLSLATGSRQDVYLASTTYSTTNIATTGAHQQVLSGTCDAFLVKFDASGIRQWATYYGGSGNDFGKGITCAADGSIYLAGNTMSSDLIATAGSQKDTNSGGSDAFLVKFDASGTRQWATYFGGPDNDVGVSLSCDTAGNIYMAGNTTSKLNVATPGCHQDTFGGGVASGRPPTLPNDVFLAKYDPSGILQWSTYYGGNSNDDCGSVRCDGYGNIYIVGKTRSSFNIATSGSFQDTITHNGTANNWNVFLVRFNEAGQRIWGTYQGGSGGYDDAFGVTCDPAGNIYVAGYSNSPSLATAGAYKLYNSTIDAFLTKFDVSGNRIWATYYGGAEEDYYTGVSCDQYGNIYAAGYTRSISGVAPQGSTPLDTPGGKWDVFLTHFDTAGAFIEATYYGDTLDDFEARVACDQHGKIYLAGITRSSSGIATPGSHQDTIGGSDGNADLFLVKFQPCTVIPPDTIYGNVTVCPGGSFIYRINPVAGATSYTWSLPAGWSGTSTADSISVTSGTAGGLIMVTANGDCNNSIPRTLEVQITDLEVGLMVNEFLLSTVRTWNTYQWYRNDTALPGATHADYMVTANGRFKVRVTDENGCIGFSKEYPVNNVSVREMVHAGDGIRLYPNPVRDQLFIHAPYPVYITIRSAEGKVILSQDQARQIYVGGLAAGIYFIEVADSERHIIHREQLSKY